MASMHVEEPHEGACGSWELEVVSEYVEVEGFEAGVRL